MPSRLDENNKEDAIIDEGNKVNGLGLLVTFQVHAEDPTYSFIHLTLQEYLTALHIARQPDSEILQTIQELKNAHSQKLDLDVIWLFLFGVLDYSKPITVTLFNDMLDEASLYYHLQYAYELCDHCNESTGSNASTEVLRYHKNHLHLSYITPLELTYVTYVLKTASDTHNTIKLSFSWCTFGVDDAEHLLREIGVRKLSLTAIGW